MKKDTKFIIILLLIAFVGAFSWSRSIFLGILFSIALVILLCLYNKKYKDYLSKCKQIPISGVVVDTKEYYEDEDRRHIERYITVVLDGGDTRYEVSSIPEDDFKSIRKGSHVNLTTYIDNEKIVLVKYNGL
jgi:hypothetical protein